MSKFKLFHSLASYIDCIYSNWVFNWFLAILVDVEKVRVLWVFLHLFHMLDDLYIKDVDGLGVINRSARNDDLLYRENKEAGHSSLTILNISNKHVYLYRLLKECLSSQVIQRLRLSK